MKKIIGALILGGLFSTGLLAMSSEKFDKLAPPASINEADQPAPRLSVNELLRAHGVDGNADSLSAFAAEAVRLTSRPAGIDRELSSFFERHVSVAMTGDAYKRHIADPLRQIEQSDLFDGGRFYHAMTDSGRLAEEAHQMNDSQSRGFEFSVKTFSLVPILKRLSDPATEVVYTGRTAYGLDKFNVKTATDSWTLYADANHLICRLEAGNRIIEFANYRTVDGFKLPFIQRLSIDGQLAQELVFTAIALNSKHPSSYFSREALLK